MSEFIRVPINEEAHIAEARRNALLLARDLGFSRTDAYHLATAVTELATNIHQHAGGGEVRLRAVARRGAVGIEVVAHDDGPGIADIGLALREGFSTAGSLGCGLPGARRLMDEMEIRSEAGRGTWIRACKWIAAATAKIAC